VKLLPIISNGYKTTYPFSSLFSNLSFGVILKVESEAFQASIIVEYSCLTDCLELYVLTPLCN
jgi:hypothetical protein